MRMVERNWCMQEIERDCSHDGVKLEGLGSLKWGFAPSAIIS